MSHAFYFVVDERLVDIASAQALHVAKIWNCDVHIFVERNYPTVAVRTVDHVAVTYHIDELSGLLPDGLPSSPIWPPIVYKRLLPPQLLSHYDRLIYLDADVHCLEPAPEIWSIDLPSGLAAVEDFGLHFDLFREDPHPSREEWLQATGIRSGRYFNAGVLVIEPRKWLQIDIRASLIEYFTRYPHPKYLDQDFLSWLFDGIWTELSPRFNFQASLFSLGLSKAISPVFVHFCQIEKPWFGWRTPGMTNLDEVYREIYDHLIRSVGADPASFYRPQRVPLYRRVTLPWRRAMSRIGVPSLKERRSRLERRRRLEIFSNYVNGRLCQGHFADEKRRALPKVQDELHFNGRYLVASVKPIAEAEIIPG